MDKLLGDMGALCQDTATERVKRYRKSMEMARISELLLADGWLMIDGGTKIRIPVEEGWTEQIVKDEEMAKIGARDDIVGEILYHDGCEDTPDYGKSCEETLKDAVDELQDIVELIEGYSMIDLLQKLEANIGVYNG